MTQELVSALQAQRLGTLQGSRAVIILGERTTLRVDPALFHEVLGSAAFPCLARGRGLDCQGGGTIAGAS